MQKGTPPKFKRTIQSKGISIMTPIELSLIGTLVGFIVFWLIGEAFK
jgi:hypothetical protein